MFALSLLLLYCTHTPRPHQLVLLNALEARAAPQALPAACQHRLWLELGPKAGDSAQTLTYGSGPQLLGSVPTPTFHF